MRYRHPGPALFKQNRQRALGKLPAGGVLLVTANAEVQRTGHVNYPFRQNSNFFWLTGLETSEAVIMLAPGSAEAETIFVRELSAKEEQWQGGGPSLAEISRISGVKNILPLSTLKENLNQMGPVRRVYLNQPPKQVVRPSHKLARQLRVWLPSVQIENAGLFLAPLRAIKSPAEIKLIKKAIAITGEGIGSVRKVLKPGMAEYELEAVLSGVYQRHGGTHSFLPIIASGANACTIHYEANASKIGNHQYLLIDTGAEYANYAADISRTLAVGSPSARQRQVYEQVLKIQKAAIKLMKPGVTFKEFETAVIKMVLEALIELGLGKGYDLDSQKSKREFLTRYYGHATTHFLGIDVHDVGGRYIPWEPGMVLTCEPGIYIKEEGIGVRIEDDILITPKGAQNLSQSIRKTLAN